LLLVQSAGQSTIISLFLRELLEFGRTDTDMTVFSPWNVKYEIIR
jgi:hypothetical protein